jgi:hypothetical protein
MSVWLKAATTDSLKWAMVYGGTASFGQGFGIVSFTGNWWFYGQGAGRDMDSTIAVDTEWHHHAVTFDGTTLSYYYDGDLANFANRSGLLNTPDSSMYFGERTNASGLNYPGHIDEASFWDVDLNSSEISEIYNNGCPSDLMEHSKVANLDSWWPMGDGDTYPTLLDVVGSNDATMTNMSANNIVYDVKCDTVSSSSSSS